jgi:hypothetical protein
MSTVRTYYILSFCTNCHICLIFLMLSFKSCIRRKSQSFPKSLKKYTSSDLEIEFSTFVPCERRWLWYRITHCQLKYTGCGTVWSIARWNTLVVVPYDILLGCTGRGTAWLIARWNTLVVVPHSTLTVAIHWSWYRITYCQVKYTGCDTV